MALSFLQQLISSRRLPATTLDGVSAAIPPRASRYNETYGLNPIPTKHLLADEGAYFVAGNVTAGTGIALGVLAAISYTAGAVYCVQNTSTPGDPNAKRLYLDYIKQIVTVVPASSTGVRLVGQLDILASRLPSANNVTFTNYNTNSDDSTKSAAVVQGFSTAPMTTTAATGTSMRQVANLSNGNLPVLNDELVFKFGSVDFAGFGTGTTAASKVVHGAPIVIGPGQFALFYEWFPSNSSTGLSAESEIGWFER